MKTISFFMILAGCFSLSFFHEYGHCSVGVNSGCGVLPEGASVVGVNVPLEGVCEYIVRPRELRGEEGGRRYSVFEFSDSCDHFNLNNIFQIGPGVSVNDIPEFMNDYDMARAVVMNPRGEGWEAAMEILRKSEIVDIIMIDRRGGVWDVDVRVCENGIDGDACQMAGFSFPPKPEFPGDIKAYWID